MRARKVLRVNIYQMYADHCLSSDLTLLMRSISKPTIAHRSPSITKNGATPNNSAITPPIAIPTGPAIAVPAVTSPITRPIVSSLVFR